MPQPGLRDDCAELRTASPPRTRRRRLEDNGRGLGTTMATSSRRHPRLEHDERPRLEDNLAAPETTAPSQERRCRPRGDAPGFQATQPSQRQQRQNDNVVLDIGATCRCRPYGVNKGPVKSTPALSRRRTRLEDEAAASKTTASTSRRRTRLEDDGPTSKMKLPPGRRWPRPLDDAPASTTTTTTPQVRRRRLEGDAPKLETIPPTWR
jgi:hypothetical protein